MLKVKSLKFKLYKICFNLQILNKMKIINKNLYIFYRFKHSFNKNDKKNNILNTFIILKNIKPFFYIYIIYIMLIINLKTNLILSTELKLYNLEKCFINVIKFLIYT